ncbi:hypothetical protein K435DRAFT_521954 [Dendrothele bispora CBS 962.96]|uniref:Cora-domain-containing protein n=1 Tax=Dendrothele bispora (strain CBS 962.96) TaxID=1314807 RepID=A0A4S8M8U7_DENBC|nr:hypothetical protein K435DRAFT_521954 [Dendrothele bispora CBS 962.96]
MEYNPQVLDDKNLRLLRMRPPSFRHGTPSGPWPWLDLTDRVDRTQLLFPPSQPNPDYDHDESQQERMQQQDEVQEQSSSVPELTPTPSEFQEWTGYPQVQFANWTSFQRGKSAIASLVEGKASTQTRCSVYQVNIHGDGTFHDSPPDPSQVISGGDTERESENVEEFWEYLKKPISPEVKVRAFFVDQLSGPVLQMLGTKFHIEPFFFSSSLNCIPSRYQEQIQPGKGDHITITLRFIRILPDLSTRSPSPADSDTASFSNEDDPMMHSSFQVDPGIDIQGTIILPDLLAFHIVRRNANPTFPRTPPLPPDPNSPNRSESIRRPTFDAPPHYRQQSSGAFSTTASSSVSTIISYHRPSVESYVMTTAQTLHERMLAAGRSVYWSNIFKDTVDSGDPNFVALTLLWYAMYSWDEVYELLLSEVALLESRTLSTIPSKDTPPSKNSHQEFLDFTRQLHVIRAHLLHHESLLSDFRKSVMFLRDTRNPAYTGKAGLAENAEYGTSFSFDSPKRRRSSTRKDRFSFGSYGGPRSFSFDRRRSSTSDKERNRFREGVGSTSASGSVTRILPQEDTISEEPDSLNEEANELLENAQTEEEFREGLLYRECANLIHEIDRLEMSREMLDRRLGNVMALAFSSINIEDSDRMKRLAERSGRDSAVMKQISYLTMIFLPASFMATIFGMNVQEINPGTLGTIPHFLAGAIALTAVTIWIMMLQYRTYRTYKHHTTKPSSLIHRTPRRLFKSAWNSITYPFRVLIKEIRPWQGRRNGMGSWNLEMPERRVISSTYPNGHGRTAERGEETQLEERERRERRASTVATSVHSLRTRPSKASVGLGHTTRHGVHGKPTDGDLPMEVPVEGSSEDRTRETV